MTDLERVVEEALYEQVQTVSRDKSIVRDAASGRLFYKKRLSVYNPEVFAYLKDHKSRYVPGIEAYWQDGDSLIVIEEFIQGNTLEELLENPPAGEEMSFNERIRILTELCDGLTFLHSALPPIIHRDLKASNIMLTRDGVVKIIDYDAAKIYVRGQEKDTTLIGTQGIAAPEQYGFAASDARTDIYALGKLIERMLPDNRDAARITARATNMDPKRRYASAAQMRQQILRIREKASGFDTILEKVPGYNPRSKVHRIASRLLVLCLLAVLAFSSCYAYEHKIVLPRRQEQEIAAMLQSMSEGGQSTETIAAQSREFLQKWPYDALDQEEQKSFRIAARKVIAYNCQLTDYLTPEGNSEYLADLTELGLDFNTVESIRNGGKLDYLTGKNRYVEALEILPSLEGLPDEEEMQADVLDKCMAYTGSLEKTYDEEPAEASAKKILTLYEGMMEDGTMQAVSAYDAFYEKVLAEAEQELSSGNYEGAEKLFAVLQDRTVPESLEGEDSIERRIVRTNYLRGKHALEEGDYVMGRKYFRAAGDYEDAAAMDDECAYQQAALYSAKDQYKNAAVLYDEISSYKDARDLSLKARYDYCLSTQEKPNETTYDYLNTIKAAGYPGTGQLENEISKWHAQIDTGVQYKIGSEQAASIRATLYGGPEGASTHVTFEVTDTVTGSVSTWTSEETCKRGEKTSANYYISTFEYSIFEREYTVRVYADDGSQIGSWAGHFKDDFLRD